MSAPAIHTTDQQRPVTAAEMDARFDAVMMAFQAQGAALEALAAKLMEHDRRFDALDEKLDKLLTHFNLT